VTEDKRIDNLALMRRAGVMLTFAEKGVIVRAANAGVTHLENNGASLGLGDKKASGRVDAWSFHHGRTRGSQARNLRGVLALERSNTPLLERVYNPLRNAARLAAVQSHEQSGGIIPH
jgi:hypothetical protein